MSFETGTYDEDKTYEDGNQYADDKKLRIRFTTRAVKNEFESNKAGRAIFYDAEYIEIIIPGSRDISIYPLDEHYRKRFKERYDKWKAEGGGGEKLVGTLLAELPWMTKSQIAELNYSNIQTVEQLAELSDQLALQFMGNHKLRERAKNFLKAAAGEAPAIALQAALEERDNHIQVLERKMEAMQAEVARMSAEQNKRK